MLSTVQLFFHWIYLSGRIYKYHGYGWACRYQTQGFAKSLSLVSLCLLILLYLV